MRGPCTVQAKRIGPSSVKRLAPPCMRAGAKPRACKVGTGCVWDGLVTLHDLNDAASALLHSHKKSACKSLCLLRQGGSRACAEDKLHYKQQHNNNLHVMSCSCCCSWTM